MMPPIGAFLADEDGATSIEYALITGLIFLAVVVGVTSFGTRMNSMFQSVADGYLKAGG